MLFSELAVDAGAVGLATAFDDSLLVAVLVEEVLVVTTVCWALFDCGSCLADDAWVLCFASAAVGGCAFLISAWVGVSCFSSAKITGSAVGLGGWLLLLKFGHISSRWSPKEIKTAIHNVWLERLVTDLFLWNGFTAFPFTVVLWHYYEWYSLTSTEQNSPTS